MLTRESLKRSESRRQPGSEAQSLRWTEPAFSHSSQVYFVPSVARTGGEAHQIDQLPIETYPTHSSPAAPAPLWCACFCNMSGGSKKHKAYRKTRAFELPSKSWKKLKCEIGRIHQMLMMISQPPNVGCELHGALLKRRHRLVPTTPLINSFLLQSSS